jgi:hypothetical protein
MIVTGIKVLLNEQVLLCKKYPYVNPIKKAVSVKPGKYAPVGNKIAPKISHIAEDIPPINGPYKIPMTASGTNPNPILTSGVDIEKNLDKII